MLRGIIFDLDGTLLDTLPICMESFRRAFQKYTGKDYNDKDISSLFGPSEEGVIKKVVPSNSEQCLQYYLEQYRLLHNKRKLLFPGIIDILKMLKKQNIKMAIVSGKGRKSMEISLEYSSLKRYFSEVYTGNIDGIKKSEHLNIILRRWKIPEETVYYVGDTASDIRGARKAGILSIAALWGGENISANDVLAENPDLVFDNTESFRQWIESQLA